MKNPHNHLSKGPDGEWTCQYCGVKGTVDELDDTECSHVYPPCPYCGQAPLCAPDCKGVGLALSGAGVYLATGRPA